ncbi:hypothetical protein [Amycolatopsis regifaucium]|uniref:Uncharacterized protein n=1 Tax=Amycolatopsis regifaucium TaxID=546365 RepID=A0A154MNA2_9PSEU|nr:hypothetical protein [Amycolatopsis regifaucium]KZB84899.1 hypothetical protein AVL48_01440 [Amycolatopsis regifaucium]OKA03917.1 hypothetical protein ATP06_0232295 [Amycolatopsis regifaucium]SFI00699.1 hypothetical protein SAMN04489731_107405 [Amycolatopsis regifaucium]
MTDESRGIGGTVGPPWSVDVLADLHAGVLDEREAAELWPLVNADPEALAIIEALEATTADLAELANEPVAPMPAEFAARLDAALAAEMRASPAFQGAPQGPQAPVAPVVDLAAARRKRNKRIGWGAGIATVAAAAIAAVAIVVPTTQQTTPGGVAQPPPAPTGPSVGGDGGGAEALVGKAVGVRDFGSLKTEERLDACVAAAGLDPDVRPEGIRPVNVAGKDGVMVIYTTGKLAQFRIVAFGADCGPGNPAILFDKIIGQK